MSFDGWLIFASFWVVFVTTPGPNAVNCIQNGMVFGFPKALWGVAAILVQALLFLSISAVGVAAIIAASPSLFWLLQIMGAVVLVWLGVRTWRAAGDPPTVHAARNGMIFGRAFMIATLNVKSIAGYVAAFSQFIDPDVELITVVVWLFPTAICITAASYVSYTAVGVALGKAALGAVFNIWFRRGMAVLFIVYGVVLGVWGQTGGAS